jgi:very-short-patch-repair endonuclease
MKYNTKVVITYFVSSGLPKPELEFKFHPVRKFRFDFAWPKYRVALEVQGGIWIAGGHSRGAGVVKDMEKENHACQLGWRVLKVQPKELCMLETVDMIKRTISFK